MTNDDSSSNNSNDKTPKVAVTPIDVEDSSPSSSSASSTTTEKQGNTTKDDNDTSQKKSSPCNDETTTKTTETKTSSSTTTTTTPSETEVKETKTETNTDETSTTTTTDDKRKTETKESPPPSSDSTPTKESTPPTKPPKKHPLRDIKIPHTNDVLYGRGGGTNHHPGNKRYRQMVDSRKVDYVNSKRLDKPLVALDIIRQWRAQDPPGRFLKQDECTGLWHDVGDRKAREKTSQALREKAPLLRRQMGEERRGGSFDDEDVSPRRRVDFVPSTHHRRHDSDGPPVKRSVLLRDHSLGRDYLDMNEGLSLHGFSWQEPVHKLADEQPPPTKIEPSPHSAWRSRAPAALDTHLDGAERLPKFSPMNATPQRERRRRESPPSARHVAKVSPISGSHNNTPSSSTSSRRRRTSSDELPPGWERWSQRSTPSPPVGALGHSSSFPPPGGRRGRQSRSAFEMTGSGQSHRLSDSYGSVESGERRRGWEYPVDGDDPLPYKPPNGDVMAIRPAQSEDYGSDRRYGYHSNPPPPTEAYPEYHSRSSYTTSSPRVPSPRVRASPRPDGVAVAISTRGLTTSPRSSNYDSRGATSPRSPNYDSRRSHDATPAVAYEDKIEVSWEPEPVSVGPSRSNRAAEAMAPLSPGKPEAVVRESSIAQFLGDCLDDEEGESRRRDEIHPLPHDELGWSPASLSPSGDEGQRHLHLHPKESFTTSPPPPPSGRYSTYHPSHSYHHKRSSASSSSPLPRPSNVKRATSNQNEQDDVKRNSKLRRATSKTSTIPSTRRTYDAAAYHFHQEEKKEHIRDSSLDESIQGVFEEDDLTIPESPRRENTLGRDDGMDQLVGDMDKSRLEGGEKPRMLERADRLSTIEVLDRELGSEGELEWFGDVAAV